MVAIIKSIQHVTVTPTTGTTGGTVAITAVDTSKSVIFPRGARFNGGTAGGYAPTQFAHILTSSVLVTANRGLVSGTTTNIDLTVVEFNSFVNSIQTGSITVTTGTTGNTAAINPVSTRAFVLYQGYNLAEATSAGAAQAGVSLNSSVQVQAHTRASSLAQSVRYAVVDLTSDLVESVQPLNTEFATTSTADVFTIASVDVGRTLVFDGGHLVTGATAGAQGHTQDQTWTIRLAGPTSVMVERASSTATANRRHLATVVQFQAQAFATTVERGSITVTSAAATATATIAAVTTLGFLNTPHFQARCTTIQQIPSGGRFSLSLASTLVTLTRYTTVHGNFARFEVVQWSTGIGAAPTFFRLGNLGAIPYGVPRGLQPMDYGVLPSVVEQSL